MLQLEKLIDLSNSNVYEVTLTVDTLRQTLKNQRIHMICSDSNRFLLKSYRYFKRHSNLELPFLLYFGLKRSDVEFWNQPDEILKSAFFRNFLKNRPYISTPLVVEQTPIIQCFSNPLIRSKIYSHLDLKDVVNLKKSDASISLSLRN